MRVMLGRALSAALSAALAMAVPAAAGERPRRVVSLNLCLDPLVLELVAHERIAALSWLAADGNVSPIADRVAGMPLVRGGAEEVLALDPDLVLAGEHTTPATVDLLRRLGRRVEVVPMAQDLDGVRRAIRAVAKAAGEAARGEDLVARFDGALRQAAGSGAHREAVVYQANGIASSTGTLASAALEAAGFVNAAERMAPAAGGRISLESLVTAPPDLIAIGQQPAAYRTPMADNLRHPALARVLAQRPHVDLPMPLWLCGTPYFSDAVATLARARAALNVRAAP